VDANKRDLKNDKFLNVQNLADMFGVTVYTVYLWVRSDLIPHFKIGGCIRFSAADLEEWSRRSSKTAFF